MARRGGFFGGLVLGLLLGLMAAVALALAYPLPTTPPDVDGAALSPPADPVPPAPRGTLQPPHGQAPPRGDRPEPLLPTGQPAQDRIIPAVPPAVEGAGRHSSPG